MPQSRSNAPRRPRRHRHRLLPPLPSPAALAHRATRCIRMPCAMPHHTPRPRPHATPLLHTPLRPAPLPHTPLPRTRPYAPLPYPTRPYATRPYATRPYATRPHLSRALTPRAPPLAPLRQVPACPLLEASLSLRMGRDPANGAGGEHSHGHGCKRGGSGG